MSMIGSTGTGFFVSLQPVVVSEAWGLLVQYGTH